MSTNKYIILVISLILIKLSFGQKSTNVSDNFYQVLWQSSKNFDSETSKNKRLSVKNVIELIKNE